MGGEPNASSGQARKLGLKDGVRVWLDGAPAGWSLDDPPPGLVVADGRQDADVVLSFFTSAAALVDRLPDLAEAIHPNGALWVCWPRRAAGHRSDITDNVIREHALPLGVVDNKIAALDADWSALRLVWRRELRASR